MSNNKVDYYKILQVPKTSTVEQIKKAYKKLAIKWHPDKNPDNKDEAVERFRDISEAYEVLSNEQKRKKYDLYGFDGAKISSGSTRFNFSDANDLFKTFFTSTGFDNASDSSFFDAYFKAYMGGMGGRTNGGTSYYTYSKSSDMPSYYSKASSGTSGASSYSSYFSKPGADYYSKYTTTGTSGNNTYTPQSSSTTQNQELPPEGQTIKKVHHVTRKFANGSQETIKRTTVISSDGSKQITEQNLDGTNKKTYHVLGGGSKKAETQSPPKSSNFSGYNFGKRQSTTTEDTNKQQEKKPEEPKPTYTSSGSTGQTGGTSYRTYYSTTGSPGTSSATYNDLYAKLNRAYSGGGGGTKVYYADGTEGVYSGGSFGGDTGKTTTKVYYTVRR